MGSLLVNSASHDCIVATPISNSNHQIRSGQIQQSPSPQQTILWIGSSSHYYLIKPPPRPHRWQQRKSIGLHLHLYGNGNENWGYAQGTTKFCGRDVIVPIPHVSAADLHHCSAHEKEASYAGFG